MIKQNKKRKNVLYQFQYWNFKKLYDLFFRLSTGHQIIKNEKKKLLCHQISFDRKCKICFCFRSKMQFNAAVFLHEKKNIMRAQ